MLFSESFHRSFSSVVAALVPSARKMTKRSRHSRDQDSRVSGASSKPNPEGNRALALAAVRHQKSSPLISAQEMTQSDVPRQERPGRASGDRLHSPGPTRYPEGRETVASRWNEYHLMPEREQLSASSSAGRSRPQSPSACALGDQCRSLQKEDHPSVTVGNEIPIDCVIGALHQSCEG